MYYYGKLRSASRFILFLFLCLLFLASSFENAFAANLTVGTYRLQSQRQITRTLYEFTYKADITNGEAVPYLGVAATVVSSSANTVVMDNSVTGGDIAAGATVTSSDTFTIRQNRLVKFNPSNLVWTVSGTPDNCPNDPDKLEPGACGCGVNDSDSDGDGMANCNDACPNDPGNDPDGDGICALQDACPDTFAGQQVGLTGCSASQFGATLHGKVVDTNGNPIGGVTIKIGTATVFTQTGADGRYNAAFSISEVNSDGKVFITGTKDGYTSFQTKIDVDILNSQNDYYADLALKQVVAAANFGNPSAGPITLGASENGTPTATLEIPTGSLVDGAGNPVTEEVRVELTTIDPGSNEVTAFTGSDFIALVAPGSGSGGGNTVTLDSVVLAEVTVRGRSTGTEYENLQGSARLDMRVPTADQGRYPAGTEIPLWYYDTETGVWRQEGNGTVYQKEIAPGVFEDWITAMVNHFTWWNADWPVSTHTCYRGVLKRSTPAGILPVTNINLQAEGITYNGSSYGDRNGQGGVCVSVKRSTATETEMVVFFITLDGVRQYLVSNGSGGYNLTTDRSLATIYNNPDIQASCATGWNACYNLGDVVINMNRGPVVNLRAFRTSLRDGNTTTITATVTDPDGDAISGCTWAGTGLFNTMTYSSGWMAPTTHGTYPVTVTCTDTFGVTGTSSINMISVANNPPEIIRATAVPYYVSPGGISNWTAECSDPDSDAIANYEWRTLYSGGGTIAEDIDSGNVGTASWTAPGRSGWRYQQVRCIDEFGGTSDWRTFYNYVNNNPPVVSLSATTTNVAVGSTTVITANATDPEGNKPLTYSWYAPSGEIVSGQGSSQIEYRPTHTSGQGWVRVTVRDSYGEAASQYIWIEVSNHIPTIDSLVCTGGTGAGDVRNCTAAASDPDGNSIIEYQWRVSNGSTSGGTASTATWTMPASGWTMIYVRAKDEYGAWSSWRYSNWIQVVNYPPIISDVSCIGPDRPGVAKNCTAVVADPDGDAIGGYQWSASWGSSIPPEHAVPNLSQSTVWTLPNSAQWAHLYARAVDEHGAWSGWFHVSALVWNNAPQVSISCVGGNRPFETLSCDANASDPDGDSITAYSWWATGGSFGNPSTASTTFTLPFEGTISMWVSARDQYNWWGTSSQYDITVINSAPGMTGINADRTAINAGETVHIWATATDADGDSFTCSWNSDGGVISGELVTASGCEADWTAPHGSIHRPCASVTEQFGGGSGISSTPLCVDIDVNNGPQISLSANPWQVSPGGTSTISASVNDPEGDSVSNYTWSTTCDSTLLSNESLYNVTFTAPDPFNGSCDITLTATDSRGASGTATTTVFAGGGGSCNEGQEISGTVYGTDGMPTAGQWVSINYQTDCNGSNSGQSVQTDSSGRYSFASIPCCACNNGGNWTSIYISFDKDGTSWNWSRSLDLSCGNQTAPNSFASAVQTGGSSSCAWDVYLPTVWGRVEGNILYGNSPVDYGLYGIYHWSNDGSSMYMQKWGEYGADGIYHLAESPFSESVPIGMNAIYGYVYNPVYRHYEGTYANEVLVPTKNAVVSADFGPGATGSVRGNVYDGYGNTVPDAGVEVLIQSGWGSAAVTALTDSNGVFNASGIRTGRIRVSLPSSGWYSDGYLNTSGETAFIDLNGYNVSLSGTIYDRFGQPIPYMGTSSISMYVSNAFSWPYPSFAGTNASGVYNFTGILAGDGSLNASTSGMGPFKSPIDGHYYELVDASLSWNDARAEAEARGGYLAAITSAEESQWILDTFGIPNLHYHWIGATQPDGSAEPDGGWTWSNGETWNYTNWAGGGSEPNNNSGTGSNENAAIFDHGEGSWNDIDGTWNASGYLVEYNNQDSNAVMRIEDGHYYEVVEQQLTWNEAKALATQRGGYLAHITSKAENQWISNLFGFLRLDGKWLGGRQQNGASTADEGWSWDGTTTTIGGTTCDSFNCVTTYANWAGGEPNDMGDQNVNGGQEDRLHFLHGTNADGAMWNDVAGSSIQSGCIIEFDSKPANAAPAFMSSVGKPVALSGLRRGDNHYYQVVNGAFTWGEARADAAARGGYLATITSAEESFWLQYAFNLSSLGGRWIGGTQPTYSTEPDGGWTWANGETWSFTNWAVNEPNDLGSENSLTTTDTSNDNGVMWNDLHGDTSLPGYVIEYNTLPNGTQKKQTLSGYMDFPVNPSNSQMNLDLILMPETRWGCGSYSPY